MHSRVSFHRSLHNFRPNKLNSLLLLFSDLGPRFLIGNSVSCIAPCDNPPLAILAIFKARYMSDCSSCTWPPCLAIVADMLKTYKEISCCIYILDSAITSTIYASVAFSNMVISCLDHSRGFFWRNPSARIPVRATSWCSISWTVRIHALVQHGGFALWAAMDWSGSSLRTPAVCYIINWRLCYILSHAASWCCCFRCYGQFLTVRPGSCFRWLHLQCHGELSGVCIVSGSQQVAYWKKRPSFCLIQFHPHLAEAFVEPWFAAEEVKRWW